MAVAPRVPLTAEQVRPIAQADINTMCHAYAEAMGARREHQDSRLRVVQDMAQACVFSQKLFAPIARRSSARHSHRTAERLGYSQRLQQRRADPAAVVSIFETMEAKNVARSLIDYSLAIRAYYKLGKFSRCMTVYDAAGGKQLSRQAYEDILAALRNTTGSWETAVEVLGHLARPTPAAYLAAIQVRRAIIHQIPNLTC